MLDVQASAFVVVIVLLLLLPLLRRAVAVAVVVVQLRRLIELDVSDGVRWRLVAVLNVASFWRRRLYLRFGVIVVALAALRNTGALRRRLDGER